MIYTLRATFSVDFGHYRVFHALCIQSATKRDLICVFAYPLIVVDGTAVNVTLYMHAPERPAGKSRLPLMAALSISPP